MDLRRRSSRQIVRGPARAREPLHRTVLAQQPGVIEERPALHAHVTTLDLVSVRVEGNRPRYRARRPIRQKVLDDVAPDRINLPRAGCKRRLRDLAEDMRMHNLPSRPREDRSHHFYSMVSLHLYHRGTRTIQDLRVQDAASGLSREDIVRAQ